MRSTNIKLQLKSNLKLKSNVETREATLGVGGWGWGLIKIEGASWHTDPSHFSGPRAILNWDSREELKKNQQIIIVLSVDVVLATNQSKAYRFSGRTGMTIFRSVGSGYWILTVPLVSY